MLPLIGFFTDYAKDAEGNLWLRATAITPPPQLYLGLSRDDVSRTGSLKEFSASNSPGYARVAAPPSGWNAAAAGLVTNSASIAFAANSGAGDWETAWTLFAADAPVGGNVIWMARIPPDSSGRGQTVPAGRALTFAPGAIAIQK